MSRLVFGICGLKGSGKDTLGEAIARYAADKSEWGSLFATETLSFAHLLKSTCQSVLGLTHAECYVPELKEKPLDRWPFGTPREHMQRVGTELFRNSYPGVWVRAWQRSCLESDADLILTTDYRFPDEGEALRSVGAKLIRVTRPGLTPDGHSSERPDLLDVDVEVYNTHGSAEEFQRAAIATLKDAGVLP